MNCSAEDCRTVVTESRVVPLCVDHWRLLVLAALPEVFKRYPPGRWLDAKQDYEAAFGEIKMPQPYAGRRGRPQAMMAGSSVVYFVKSGDRVKIGTTTNLRDRMASLCLPSDAVVLLTIPGGRARERMAHNDFREQRIGRSEWFHFDGKLRRFLS